MNTTTALQLRGQCNWGDKGGVFTANGAGSLVATSWLNVTSLGCGITGVCVCVCVHVRVCVHVCVCVRMCDCIAMHI